MNNGGFPMGSFLKELLENFIDVLGQFRVFTGRSSRKEFWMFFLGCIIAGVILGILTAITGIGRLIGIASSILGLVIFIPSIAVGVRRLHDTNKTGWLMLLCLIPLLGGIIVLALCAMKGTSGRNQYGHKPV
jgi:uncharacterized membrane protein YhaH (DUF805 family)